MMENWFEIDNVKKPHLSVYLKCDVVGTYFNRRSFAQELFLEDIPFFAKIRQETPMTTRKEAFVVRDQMINLNVTYGLCCNLQRVIVALLELEKMSDRVAI